MLDLGLLTIFVN